MNILTGNEPTGAEMQGAPTEAPVDNLGTEVDNQKVETQEPEVKQDNNADSQEGNTNQDGAQTEQEITYTDFKVPDGFEQPNESFLNVAKKIGLDQEKTQSLVDFYCNELVPSIQATQEKVFTNWEAQSRKDFNQDELDIANKAFGSLMKEVPELHDVIRDSGMGVNPTFIRAMLIIGQRMSEGTAISNSQANVREKTAAEILFPGL